MVQQRREVEQGAPPPAEARTEAVKTFELIKYQQTLAALTGIKIYEGAPFDGYVTDVTIHWPDGCDALVDVAVYHNTTRFCPREDYLALNDATPTYIFNRPVKQGDELWVEMLNADGSNPHTITVTISVRED